MSHSPHEMMILLIVPSFPSFCASEGKVGSHGCSYGVYPWWSSDSLWWFFFWLTSLFKCAWSLPIWLYLYIALFVTDSPAHATERKTFPWTHSLLPGATIRHRQLRMAYLETAESCWQAVRSPPVLVFSLRSQWPGWWCYIVLQSASISLLKGLSSLQFIQAHTLVLYRSWSRVLELNFQGHNTVEWGRISDLHLQEDDESKSIWGSRLQLFGVMIWRLKRKDKYEGHFHWVCAHICIYERTYWTASSLLYLNTAVKGKIFLIH